MRTKCRCGKIAWPSEAAAKDILVRLRIKASLKGRADRKEARTYHCDIAPGWWHLTSLDTWDDRKTRTEISAATDADRDADAEELLNLIEQHHAGVKRLVAHAERQEADSESLRAAIRRLATGIAHHRAQARDPDRSDLQLWTLLDHVSIPVPAGKAYLSTLLEGEWSGPEEGAEDEPGQGVDYAPSRQVAAALAALGLASVNRATLRALLPQGTTSRRVNRTSEKFGLALKEFASKNWVARSTTHVQVLNPGALLERAVRGIASPEQLLASLDVTRARELLESMPTSEERDRELAALKNLDQPEQNEPAL